MKVRVCFTPGELAGAPVSVVIDVLRATTTISQALAGGYERVVCVGEVEEARALAAELGDAALAGERGNVKPEGFDFGNSPREFIEPADKTSLVLTTTNGTRLLLAAAAQCDTVFVGCIRNLAAVVAAVQATGADEVSLLCAGVEGEFALDDAYVAGRLAEAIGGELDESAVAAIRLAGTFPTPLEGIGSGDSADNIRRVGLGEDIGWCAEESVLDLAPRIVERSASSVTIAVA